MPRTTSDRKAAPVRVYARWKPLRTDQVGLEELELTDTTIAFDQRQIGKEQSRLGGKEQSRRRFERSPTMGRAGTSGGLPNNKEHHFFELHGVFTHGASQQQVYEVAALPLVDDLLAGYNSTLFAYGQTGAGKTYSMYGPDEVLQDVAAAAEEVRGIVPKTCTRIFNAIAADSEIERATVQCSYLEIYNEQVNDLLMLGRDLKLREDREKGVYVEGLAAIEVESEQALCDVVTKGNASRATSSTAMNERSSRGHTIFLMEVSQLKRSSTDADTYTTTEAKLYLVDLAGSECIKQSQVSGAGLREAQNINKSLSTLGLCIEKLTDGKAGSEQHVPYRDSKLTRILAQTLGGNCKTTLLVALRPEAECAPECVATLRFAQRAKRLTTKIGANSKVERKTEGGGGGAAAFFFKLKNTINFADFQRKEGELKAEQTRLESQLEAEHAAHEAQLAAVQEEARRDREELQQRLRQDEEQRKKEKGKVVAGRLGNALARGEAQQSREDQRQLEQQNTAMAEELHALRAQLAAQANHGGGEEVRPGLMERTMSRAEHLTGLDLDGDGVVGEAEGRSLGGSLEESAEESWDEDTCTSPYEEEAVAGGEGIAASDDAVDAPGSPLSPPLVPPPAVHARSRGARSPRSAATWAAPSADEAPQQAASPLASPSPPVPSPPPRGSRPTREGPTARTAPATVAHAHPPDLGRARAAAEGSRGSPRGARRARGAAAPAGAPSPQPHKGRASKGQNGGSGGPLVASPPETGVWGKAWTLTELEREEELKRVNYENHQLRLHLEEAHQRLSDEAQRAEEENERMERLLVRLKRLHAENAELRTLLHEAIPDWGRRVGDAREQLGEPEAERLGDLLAEMRGLR